MNGLAHDRRSERLVDGLNRGSRRWWVLAALIVSVLVVFLDGMVLNVALPRIQQELGATQSQQEWIIAAYTLVFAVLLLPLGVVGDRFGRRRVLTVGLIVFTAGSIAGAYAATPIALIATRAATGVGAAAIVPATLAIIANTFEGDERRRAIALWVAASGVAVVLGPLVGGALLDIGFWWGSVLLINAPVVALALGGIRRWVPESFDSCRPRLDILGGLLAVTGLGLFVFGLIRAGQTGQWTAPDTLASMVLGLTVVGVFIRFEARTAHAALDVHWFRQPALATAAATMALAMFAMYGAMLYGIYFLQFERGYTPLAAGSLLAGNAAAILIVAPLTAVWTKRYGARSVCAAGFVILAGTYGAMTAVGHATPIAAVEVLLILLGAGSAMVVVPTTDIVMASIPRERAGAASAFNSAIRSIGGALGIAVLGSVLSTAYRARISESLNVLPQHLRDAAGESIGGTQAVVAAVHDRLAEHGAPLLASASTAFLDAMHVAAILSAAAAALAFVLSLLWIPQRLPRQSAVGDRNA